jgi:hypothetical protein
MTPVGLLLALLQFVPPSARPQEPRPHPGSWATLGVSLGALFAPGEIGRDVNQTGGEDLIAFLGDGVLAAVQAGRETRHVGVEFSLGLLAYRINVENEFGARFPHHGKSPWLYSFSLRGFPLALAPGLDRRAPVQPWVGLGGGGMIMSVDLDNVDGQTLYHSWQWSLGGGIRLPVSRGSRKEEQTVVELRVVRYRVGANGPLRGFDALGATLGLGLRI